MLTRMPVQDAVFVTRVPFPTRTRLRVLCVPQVLMPVVRADSHAQNAI